MKDIFEVQDDIASRVALAMKVTLSGDTGHGGRIETVDTDNVAAFEKYLQGLQQKSRNSFESLLLAETFLKSALAIDPGFFDARLELAHTYRDQQNLGVIPFEVAGERIEPLLEQLLVERPDDGLVLMIAGYIDFIHAAIQGEGDFDVEAQITRLESAVGRTPNEARLYMEMSHHLRVANRRDEAFEWLKRGVAVDPLDWRLHMEIGKRLMSMDDLDGAQTSFMRAVELSPEAPVAYVWASEVFRHRKEHAKSFAMFSKAIELGPLDHQARALMALRLYTIGLMEEGDKYWQHANAIDPGDGFVQLAMLYRLLLFDDHTEALAMSETLLRDDTDISRGHSFDVVVFLSTMSEAGRSENALDVLEELWPGVTSPEFEPVGEQEVMLRGHVRPVHGPIPGHCRGTGYAQPVHRAMGEFVTLFCPAACQGVDCNGPGREGTGGRTCAGKPRRRIGAWGCDSLSDISLLRSSAGIGSGTRCCGAPCRTRYRSKTSWKRRSGIHG